RMNGINRVFLMGYLGNEPEFNRSKIGKPFLKMSVATHYSRRNEDGEKEPATTWHRVKVFGKHAENCRDHLHRGSAVAIEGYLSRYSYEKEDGSGSTSVTDVVAQQVHFLGKKRETYTGQSSGEFPAGPLLDNLN
ncbi:MAG: single-stranded DNA-binding protein, partial [Bdellovibrionota bacterium]